MIVGSGPNAASPHHEVSDRVIADGDVVVVDIGGTMPSGYCSDCTRTYAVGSAPGRFHARTTRCSSAPRRRPRSASGPASPPRAWTRRPGGIIDDAGYGEWFIHRTGHGIGLETHEEPYIVEGNATRLEDGMAFSIEPGIYPGPHGARIEDIVVCTETGFAADEQRPPRAGDRLGRGTVASGRGPA